MPAVPSLPAEVIAPLDLPVRRSTTALLRLPAPGPFVLAELDGSVAAAPQAQLVQLAATGEQLRDILVLQLVVRFQLDARPAVRRGRRQQKCL